jgi:hypothetical protein
MLLFLPGLKVASNPTLADEYISEIWNLQSSDDHGMV